MTKHKEHLFYFCLNGETSLGNIPIKEMRGFIHTEFKKAKSMHDTGHVNTIVIINSV